MTARSSCLALLVVAALSGCTGASTEESDSGAADGPAPVPSSSPQERLLADWASDADSSCRVGLAMYPSLALGTDADIDSVSLGTTKLYEALSQVPLPHDPADREHTSRLVEDSRQLATEWDRLATSASVPSSDRQAAVARARTVLLAVGKVGAPSCTALAPPA